MAPNARAVFQIGLCVAYHPWETTPPRSWPKKDRSVVGVEGSGEKGDVGTSGGGH